MLLWCSIPAKNQLESSTFNFCFGIEIFMAKVKSIKLLLLLIYNNTFSVLTLDVNVNKQLHCWNFGVKKQLYRTKDRIVTYITFALGASFSASGCSSAMWLLKLTIGTDIPHRKQVTVGPSSTLKDHTFNCYFKVYNNFTLYGGGVINKVLYGVAQIQGLIPLSFNITFFTENSDLSFTFS